MSQQVKNSPAVQEMQVRFLGGEDPLEESINFLVYFSTQTSHLTVRTLIILISASLAPMQTFAELNKHVLLTKATK